MSITRKLLTPLLVLVAAAWLILIAFNTWDAQATARTQEDKEVLRMRQAFAARQASLESVAVMLATQSANDPEIQATFAAGDRMQLIQLTLPTYQVLKDQYGVAQYHFHLPPATSFLRLHQLTKYGDDLSTSRFMVLKANIERRPVSGLEVGSGGLGVRGVVPVNYQGKHIGTVEFGMDIDQPWIEQLKRELHVDWQIWLSREPAKMAGFAGVADKSEGPIPDLVLLASTLPKPFLGDEANYRQALRNEPALTHPNIGNRSYTLSSVSLLDFSGNTIGVVDIILDRTEATRSQNSRLLTSTLSALLFLFVISGVFSFILTRTLRPIDVLTKTATAIAAGDLTRTVSMESRDEIGTLAKAFNSMTSQLRGFIGSLEQRVADRTHDLETRSRYLEAAAEVGRAASSILESDQLMRQVVELIRGRFDLYYVGLFLTDSSGQWAVLKAGTGQAGQAMLARGHKLPVGEGSMIGWSIANVQARIAQVALQDAVRLATAELPETRSEAALPLRSRGRVIGAITVQSNQPGVFDEATIAVLQVMADQVAVALDNAQLFAESQAALETARAAYGELSRRGWLNLLRARPDFGYKSDAQGVTNAANVWSTGMEQAVKTGQVAQAPSPNGHDKHPLAVPITVRGTVIGVLDTYKPGEAGEWTPEEVSLLQAVSEQLGQALEGARLYQDTQRRAARERLIGDITDKMQRANDMEALVQRTIQELQSALGTSFVSVHLGTSDELLSRLSSNS